MKISSELAAWAAGLSDRDLVHAVQVDAPAGAMDPESADAVAVELKRRGDAS